jgi:flagellar biosynthesis protein FlhB
MIISMVHYIDKYRAFEWRYLILSLLWFIILPIYIFTIIKEEYEDFKQHKGISKKDFFKGYKGGEVHPELKNNIRQFRENRVKKPVKKPRKRR